MPGTRRSATKWRQGHVLTDEAVAAFALVSCAGPDNTIAVVISHDCDIAADPDIEPSVEVVIGRRIEKLGADANAKTARRLHIAFHQSDAEIPVELEITTKTCLSKQALLAGRPKGDIWLNPEGLLTLRHWLAARYHRAAFADAFEQRLKAKPGKLSEKIRKAMDDAGEHVLAVFFDVDGGDEKERNGPDDVYELRITLLYDSMKDEPAAYEAAQKAADAIESAFEVALRHDGTWRNIKLLSCDVVSDSAMTVADSRMLKRWRLDHMSLKKEPPQVMMPPN